MSAILVNQYGDKRASISVTISSGGTTSTVADLGGLHVVGIEYPATMTGTSITFEVSNDNSTFLKLGNNGNAYSYTVTTGNHRAQDLDFLRFVGWRYIRVVSGSSEGADRALKINAIPHMPNR